MTLDQLNRLIPDENAARLWMEQGRWPAGPECPHCGQVGRAWFVTTKRVWCCQGCRRQFSVTAGTPMHQTRLPLRTWVQAMWLMSSSPKGISALKLGQWLGVQYRTAWHLAHRIRAMMAEASPVLKGIVEIDETYAGAPPRKRAKSERIDDDDDRPPNSTGRGTKRPLVLVAAERGGRVDAQVIATHGKTAIASALVGRIAPDATVMTDGLPAYKHIGAKQPHLAVNHSARQYARTDEKSELRVHVNTVECFNSHLRRAVVGVFHQISAKHLARYTVEIAFRWNRRGIDFATRLLDLVRNGDGRLLPCRHLMA